MFKRLAQILQEKTGNKNAVKKAYDVCKSHIPPNFERDLTLHVFKRTQATTQAKNEVEEDGDSRMQPVRSSSSSGPSDLELETMLVSRHLMWEVILQEVLPELRRLLMEKYGTVCAADA